MVFKEDYFQWFIRFLKKKSALLNKSSGSGAVNKPNYQLVNEPMNQLLETFKKEKFIHFLEAIFGMLI